LPYSRQITHKSRLLQITKVFTVLRIVSCKIIRQPRQGRCISHLSKKGSRQNNVILRSLCPRRDSPTYSSLVFSWHLIACFGKHVSSCQCTHCVGELHTSLEPIFRPSSPFAFTTSGLGTRFLLALFVRTLSEFLRAGRLDNPCKFSTIVIALPVPLIFTVSPRENDDCQYRD